MKIYLSIILCLICAANAFGQIERLVKVKETAKTYFDDGVKLYLENKTTDAFEKFDKAKKYLLNANVINEERPALLEYIENLSDRIHNIQFGEKSPPKSAAEAGKTSTGFNEQAFDPKDDPLAKPFPADGVLMGKKPIQAKDGKVQAVMEFFDENFNDPYSMRFVRWSNIEKALFNSEPCWAVTVKFRAKNGFGAYVLSEPTFYIQKNKIVGTSGLK